jgi:hypothetical protein
MTTSPKKSPVRECDGCTLCCKVMGIAALNKPPGLWCSHCAPTSGCRIYDDRPEECRTFNCGYLLQPELGPEWKPSECKMVLMTEGGGRTIVAHVDPQRADAWRREPYYSTFRMWVADNDARGLQVVIAIGRRRIRIHRDRDEDLHAVG